MTDARLDTLRVLEHLRDHFTDSDRHLRPPIGVRDISLAREKVVLNELHAGGYVAAIARPGESCPVIILGLTELGRLAARGGTDRSGSSGSRASRRPKI